MTKKLLIGAAIVSCMAWLGLLGGCQRERILVVHKRQLTSEWHKQEEAKIDTAVRELRSLGRWDEKWDKFSKLGDYGWRGNMDCRDSAPTEARRGADGSVPCMSGGYTYSPAAFEQLKRGDQSHNAHNTPEEGFKSFKAVVKSKQQP